LNIDRAEADSRLIHFSGPEARKAKEIPSVK